MSNVTADISETVAVDATAGRASESSADGDTDVNQTASSADMRSWGSYADTFAGFDTNQMRVFSEVKRFMECYEGDRDFRASADAGGRFTDEQRAMLKDVGVTFEPEAMALMWEQPQLFTRYPSQVAHCADFEDLPSDLLAPLTRYPELRLWLSWRHDCERMRMIHKLRITSKSTFSPEYDAWRARRVGAVRNELGWFGWSLDHPCHAVEMAVGCSVGCGFCAFDAGKLQTVFDLSRAENRELVAGVALGMANVLGWPAAHGMLYWSTEPNDNPHYVRLLGFWEELTGAKLCTATARASEDWVRDLIGFYSKGPVQWPRISVLTRAIMRRLHKAFTPLEMRDTTLLMQQKDSEVFRAKVPGGRERMLRQLVEADDLRDVDLDNPPEGFQPPQGSIACISGPLVNMVNRTVKLISPCYTTMENRYGYRVFDETTFGEGPGDFERALKRIIGRSMVVRPYPEMPVRWRDDLKVVSQPDGFTLVSPVTQRDFRRGELHVRTAEEIGRGDRNYGQVFDALADDPGIGPMTAMSMLESLFSKGYLCELAVAADYRARQEARDASLRDTAAA
ncbi:MAG: hypothetical protein OXC11_16145 [Rhodospirillales bacterium]|nr:hypothetical protein [Rhodospirillales bacterium]